MADTDESIEQPEAETSEAIETSSPDVTGSEEPAGSEASSETEEDNRTHAEKARDDFLKEYGEPDPEETAAATADEDDPDDDPSEQKTDGEEEDDEHRISDEEFKGSPPGVRKRIGYLTSQQKKLRKEVEGLTTERDEYRQSHEQIEHLRNYSAEKGLAAEMISEALETRAMLEGQNFRGFLDAVLPYVQLAQRALGEAVAPDIQQLIDDGELTPEIAKRLTQSEANAQLAKQEAERRAQALSARDTQDAEGQRLQSVKRAIAETEAALRASDPNFAQKAPALTAQMRATFETYGIPQSGEAAAALIRKLHQNFPVQKRPKPTPTAPRPGASPAKTRTAAPTSMQEAMALAAETAPTS